MDMTPEKPSPTAGMCSPPPRDKWEGVFWVRSAKVIYRSYQENRDDALVEMMILIHQLVEEPYGIKLVDLSRI